MIMYSYLKV